MTLRALDAGNHPPAPPTGHDAPYHALFARSPDAILLADAEGRCLDANDAALALLGLTRLALPNLDLERTIGIPSALWSDARQNGGWRGDVELHTSDGTHVPAAAQAISLPGFEPELVALYLRPAAQRRKRADAQSERLFRAAFADAPIGMALIDRRHRIVQVNRALCDLLGYTDTALLDSSIVTYSHPDDISRTLALVERALSGEIDRFSLEKRYCRRDGQFVWALVSGSLVRGVDGKPDYLIAQILDISERKSASLERAATHQSLREVLERITDGFFAVDPDWRFTYINAAAERVFGYARNDLIGRSLWEVFPGVAASSAYAAYHEAMATGTVATIELYYGALDGWFEVRAFPSPGGLSVFFRNVTESRRLTQELRESEAQYRTLVEQLPLVVYRLANDEKQTRHYYSPYLREVAGFDPETALAHFNDGHWLDLIHPDDRERVARIDRETTETGAPFRAEYRFARPDGREIWLQDECLPLRDESGAITGWQGVLIDITDRVQAEMDQRRLAAIVEGAEDAIISRALDGTITSWNRGAEQLYGFRADEAIGRSITMIFPKALADDGVLREDIFGEQPTRVEGVRHRKDGSPVEVAIALSPIRNRNGTLIGVASIARDISERKRAEAELREALDGAQAGVRAKSRFLAMMSHELRTPLQAVLGYADLLLQGSTETFTPEQIEDIRTIRLGAGRMAALIDQMLELSRLEAGRLELTAEAVDLATIIEQVRQDVAPQAWAKGLRLDISTPSSLPPAVGDAERVRQILLNLVGNAVKFTEAGGVRVSARTTSAGIEVAVSDTGIGIAREALPHIFEEFRQADSSTTRRYGGAGLGLAIATRLAEQMGGSITVQSEPGAGSTFRLHLAAAKKERARLAGQASQRRASRSSR
ncbi:MAG: PAS domain S-box protein [Thermomicrobiales bacterium]|nr:PAS domain S-box protein [Thermomicrobiales bacterium]